MDQKIGYIVPAFEQCEISNRAVKHPKEPVPLWQAPTSAAPEPTIRAKEHAFVFNVAKKKFTSKIVKCSFPYDLAEIMNFGHTISDQISDQPSRAEFPPPQWQDRVQIIVKRFCKSFSAQ
jgi:hypothetical protein